VQDKLLGQVERAAAKVAKTKVADENARRELRAAIRTAHSGGCSLTSIGRVLGISRQRVAELVREDD
jgi:transposase-like protein